MGFFKRLFGGGEQQSEDRALHLYIKCNRCGAPVHVRIDPNNDLSAAEYGDTEAEGFWVRKEVMDDRCFRIMHAELQFDSKRRETSREIDGGTFISQPEYDELRAARTSGAQR